MSKTQPPLIIIAGGGDAPLKLAETCDALGRPNIIIGLRGQTDPATGLDRQYIELPIGAFGKLKSVIAEHKAQEVVMIGRIRRPSLTEIKPDAQALKVLSKIGFTSLGDDGLLRSIGRVLEEECGIRLIGAHEVVSEWLTPAGIIGEHNPDDIASADITRGIEVAQALGRVDVGQAVVVQQGIVLGVEAIEGTDALLMRCESLRRAGMGGVLVKTAKPNQDKRFDLPTVGLDTIKAAHRAGIRGIAMSTGNSLFLHRTKSVSLANEKGMFLLGI